MAHEVPEQAPPKEDEHEEMVSNAQKRAEITALLSAGGEFQVVQVAEALNLSRGTAGQLLANMALNRLVNMRKEGTSKLYSINGGGAKAKTEAVQTPKRGRGRPRKQSDDAKSIEFVISGMVISVTKVGERIRVEFVEE